MAEEDAETIGDVLTRTSGLNKEDMITEVESYGLEVDRSWTKAEIMDHFEEFLTEPEATDAPPVPEEPVPTPGDVPENPPEEVLPPVSPGARTLPPSTAYSGAVRIMRSPSAYAVGWGSRGSKAP